jgi:hypothetical protein
VSPVSISVSLTSTPVPAALNTLFSVRVAVSALAEGASLTPWMVKVTVAVAVAPPPSRTV